MDPVLDSLRLQNFRGFDEHEVPFRDLTIIVGANNAGKSTVVEALRLASLVITRIKRGGTAFTAVPEWLDDPLAYRGIPIGRSGRPAVDGHAESTFNRYSPPPAAITAKFTNRASVSVFVGPDGELHGVVRDTKGNAAGTSAEAKDYPLPRIAIQPQVAPLLRQERHLQPETVQRGEGTHLSSQHFRNQLVLDKRHWRAFKDLAEESWPQLQVTRLVSDPQHPEEPIELHVRDSDFVGEVALMGHGLQMWLQTIWFLAKTQRDSIVVLDEPDVYMHPDLQRRLLGIVRNRFAQLVIATHSIEIVEDVDPRSLLSIDRRQRESIFVTDLPAAQAVIDSLGSTHRIQLTRLMSSRVVVLVEGDDVQYLRSLQAAAKPSDHPIDLLPHFEIGGRGGWARGLDDLPRKNRAGESIKVFCILDRDNFPDEEIQERVDEAKARGVHLHIWSRKEIENFFLVPAAIARVIREQIPNDATEPTSADAEAAIDQIIQSMQTDITDGYATVIQQRDRKLSVKTANERARNLVANKYASRDGRWAIAPGKDVLARLSDWSDKNFGVTFGPSRIARELTEAEVDDEIKKVLAAVERARRVGT